jgi:phosphoglycolate phosphatase-like HAD superfamily hydrolase
MRRRCAILFDLDGTLVDINPDKEEVEQLRASLAKLALRAGLALSHRDIFGMYQDVLLSIGFDHKLSRKMRLELDKHETRWAYQRSVPKSTRLLGELRKNVQIIGIVTSNGTECVRALFGSKKIREEWFDFVVTRDDSMLLKPSAVPLKRAVETATERVHDLSEIWFVGDSEQDEKAANEFNRRVGLGLNFARLRSSEASESKRVRVTPFYSNLDEFIEEFLKRAGINSED